MKSAHRVFICISIGAMSALLVGRPSFSAAAAKLTETDPTAQSLNYVSDASKIDKSRISKYMHARAGLWQLQLLSGRRNGGVGDMSYRR
jgi:hypothetical protein